MEKFSKVYKKLKEKFGSLFTFDNLEEFGIIYHFILLQIQLGFYKFIFKGARGSRKTTVIVKWMIKTMIKDPQASMIVVMDTKVRHSKTTMREFDKWIDYYDRHKWKGFAKQWTKVDSNLEKVYRFERNGHMQEIQFLSIDELAKAGGAPLPLNYFRAFWLEEPVSSKEQYGADMDKKREEYDGIKTLNLTVLRHFSNVHKFDWENQEDFEARTKNLRFIQFYSFNPYNEDEPLLEDFKKFLPDNEEKLKKDGFDYALNEEKKEVYMTSNYLLNKYLPDEWNDEMEEIKQTNYEYYKVVGLGMNGKPIDNTYADIWDIIVEEDHKYRRPAYKYNYINFRLAIDVGNNGTGNMSLTLLGKLDTGVWIPIEEWDDENWRKKHKFDSDEIALYMIGKIKEWENKYYQMKKQPRVVIMDNDIHFKSVFLAATKRFNENSSNKLKTTFKLFLFKEKYLKDYKNEDRIPIFKYMYSSRRFMISENWTPKIYSQFKNHRTNERGKVIDGADDLRQAVEMGMYDKIPDVIGSEYLEGRVLDKSVVDFIKRRK